MTCTVKIIPAKINPFSSMPDGKPIRRRVAGYARVSTDMEEQQSSYKTQVKYYTEYIKGNPAWEFVGVYSDEGISGTSTKHREGFKKMIADALAGKIDLILTKSISRFARNTVDALTAIRKLKEKGVEVYFEKENVKTLDAKGEFLITIMSSLAQEESRSISENTKWGRRKRMAEGKFNMPYKVFLGYDSGPDNKPVINEEQAQTVRKIYQWYLDGLTCRAICRRLEQEGIKSPKGNDRWWDGTVLSILTNEKYKGEALLQKKYVVDFLKKKQKVNHGELPQFYLEDSHPAIISKEMFDAVQAERIKRNGSPHRWMAKTIYSCKVKCGACGDWFAATTWHSNDKYRREVFRCRNKYHKGTYCETGWFTKQELQQFFMIALNNRIRMNREIADNLEAINEELFSIKELESKAEDYENERLMLKKMKQDGDFLVNRRSVEDQVQYEKRRKMLEDKYNDALHNCEECLKEIELRKSKLVYFKSVRSAIKTLGDTVTEFDERLWCNLLDHMIVHDEEKITVVFKDGFEVEVPLGDLVKSRSRTASRKKRPHKIASDGISEGDATNISS